MCIKEQILELGYALSKCGVPFEVAVKMIDSFTAVNEKLGVSAAEFVQAFVRKRMQPLSKDGLKNLYLDKPVLPAEKKVKNRSYGNTYVKRKDRW